MAKMSTWALSEARRRAWSRKTGSERNEVERLLEQIADQTNGRGPFEWLERVIASPHMNCWDPLLVHLEEFLKRLQADAMEGEHTLLPLPVLRSFAKLTRRCNLCTQSAVNLLGCARLRPGRARTDVFTEDDLRYAAFEADGVYNSKSHAQKPPLRNRKRRLQEEIDVTAKCVEEDSAQPDSKRVKVQPGPCAGESSIAQPDRSTQEHLDLASNAKQSGNKRKRRLETTQDPEAHADTEKPSEKRKKRKRFTTRAGRDTTALERHDIETAWEHRNMANNDTGESNRSDNEDDISGYEASDILPDDYMEDVVPSPPERRYQTLSEQEDDEEL